MNKKKDKKEKKDKFKSKEEKIIEINVAKDKLQNLGLSTEIQGISEFYEICNDYINKDFSWSGEIKLNGTKRILQAILPNKKINKVSLNLKYDENI